MREVTDFEISAAIRRELSGRRVDLVKLKFAVSGGVVTFTGELAFIGLDKTSDEIAVEIKFIESTLRAQRGVKELKFEFENWSKNIFGKWESKSAQSLGGSSGGEGFHCPDCHTVFRFCPCCGKPLVAGIPQTSQQRRPVAGGPSLLKPLPRKIEPFKAPQLKPLPTHPQSPVEPLKPTSPFSHPTPSGIGREPAKPDQHDAGSGLPAPAGRTPARPAAPTQLRPVAPTPFSPLPGTPGPVRPFSPAPVPDTAKPSPIPATPDRHAAVKLAPPPVRPPAPTPVAPPPDVAPRRVAPPMDDLAETLPEAPPSPEPAIPDLIIDKPPAPRQVPELRPAPEAPAVLKTPAKPVQPARPAAPPPAPKEEAGEDFFDISMLPPIKPKTAEPRTKQAPPPEKPADLFDDTLLPPLKPQVEPPVARKMAEPASPPEPLDGFDDSLLPPMKPKTAEPAPIPAVKKPVVSAPAPLSFDDDTPLPPMKPAAAIEDDETPLPPMKTAAGAPGTAGGKPQKGGGDPFASLFSEIEAVGGKPRKTAGGAKEGADDLATLDLDIMDIFQKPPAKPAAGGGKPAKPQQQEQPPDPFKLGDFLDLDAPVETTPKDKPTGKSADKPKKDPFASDDFDISKFKI